MHSIGIFRSFSSFVSFTFFCADDKGTSLLQESVLWLFHAWFHPPINWMTSLLTSIAADMWPALHRIPIRCLPSLYLAMPCPPTGHLSLKLRAMQDDLVSTFGCPSMLKASHLLLSWTNFRQNKVRFSVQLSAWPLLVFSGSNSKLIWDRGWGHFIGIHPAIIWFVCLDDFCSCPLHVSHPST